MAVTHHQCPNELQGYIDNKNWREPESEAHASRSFALWAQGEYKPPVTSSLPATLGIMTEKRESEFKFLKKSHKSINSQTR